MYSVLIETTVTATTMIHDHSYNMHEFLDDADVAKPKEDGKAAISGIPTEKL